MLRKEKQAVAEDLKKKLEGAKSVFLADFTGINVKDITRLRRDFRQSNIEYLVAKNTLIKRAVADSPLEGINDHLSGPTALVLSADEGIAAARIISKFATEHDSGLNVKAAMMASKVFDGSMVAKLARLPGREVLLAQLLGGLNSPIVGFVSVLKASIGNVVRVLDQIRNVKQSQENN
jgi:large subunit ribosomal protein L10